MIGFPESETGSPNERHFHDRNIIDKLLKAMNVTDVEVKNHYRVGRSNGRHNGKRPIVIKFASMEEKWRVLKKTSALRRNPDFSSVYVNADLTPLQQVQRRRMFSELRSRRDEGEDVFLFRGRVINREQSKIPAKNDSLEGFFGHRSGDRGSQTQLVPKSNGCF